MNAETGVIIVILTAFWHSSRENNMFTLQDNFLKRLEPEILSFYTANVSHLHFGLGIFKANNTAEKQEYFNSIMLISKAHRRGQNTEHQKQILNSNMNCEDITFGGWFVFKIHLYELSI